MKTLQYLSFSALFLFILSGCSIIKVATDYETDTDFTRFKTFAFYKKGVDKAPISDIDKRRILKAIETELQAKGMTKSETPDVLISIFTKAIERVDIHHSYHPYYYGPYHRNMMSRYVEGTLFIDVVDRHNKKLVWQGVGSGVLFKSLKPKKREAIIQKFVREILERYPPENK